MTQPTPPIGDDDLQAYVDDRLPPDRSRVVGAWLAARPDLATQIAAQRSQRDALRACLAAKAAEPIPARLRLSTITESRRIRWRGHGLQVAAALVIFAAGAAAGLGWRSPVLSSRAGATPDVMRESVSAYRTFIGEVAHPVEVAASDRDHLLKWLSRRLGRPLAAPDLARLGYGLVGGRLLPAGDTAAAMLMYEAESGGRLTLYVRAGEGGETAFRFRSEGDVSTLAWLDRGFGFAVSGAIPRERLQPIADAVYREFEAH